MKWIYIDAVIFVKQENLRATTGHLSTEDIRQQSRATSSRDPATASSDRVDAGDFRRREGNDSTQRIP